MKKLLIAMSLYCLVATVGAEENPQAGQFYIAPGLFHYEAPSVERHGHEEFSDLGVVVGFALSDRWSLEALIARGESDWSNNLGSGKDDIDVVQVGALYKFDVATENWQPFLQFGVGRTESGFNGVRSDSYDQQYSVGAGIFRKLSDHISLRADFRGMTSSNDGGVTPALFLGLTGFLGQVAPPPPPPDSDGDGVPNDQDRCPTTPPGRKVDAQGCQFDADGDGVFDADDRCPDTPAGAPVDNRGCPLDSDRDGVPDFKDACPGTAAGAKVDAKGCYIELEEAVTIDMNIEFGNNRAEIRPDHIAEISRVVQFLREYPTANAAIEGHTDSSGDADYNQALSERRAKAVYDYLVNEARINASRLNWRGLGETQPIAPNNTSAGRQNNRRVSAVVTGSRTVRQ